MEATKTTFTAQDWAEHAQFVQMFRAAKARKEARTKDVEFQWEERRRVLDMLVELETK